MSARVSLTFRIFKGDQLLREETLTQHVIKIGKVQSAHLRIDDESVSRMHAILEVDPSGTVHIIDLGSTRGTFVNGAKVNKTRLQSGDTLQIGDLRLELAIAAPQPQTITETVRPPAVPAPAVPVPAVRMAPVPAPAVRMAAVPAPAVRPTAFPLAVPAAAFAITGDEDPGAKAIEVAAMLGDSVVAVKHCMNPRSGKVTPRTWGMLAAGVASVLTAGIAFYVSVANAASNKAGREAWVHEMHKPIWSFRPTEISAFYDVLAFGGIAVGLVLLAAGLLRLRRESTSPFFRIGTAPGVELPLEQTPAPSFPLVAPSGDDFVFNYAHGMDGELITEGGTIPFSQLIASGRARPSAATAGAIEVPIPMAAKIRARSGQTTFLISAVPSPKAQTTPLLSTLESRTLSYFGGSLAVHLGIWALLQLQPVDGGTAGVDMSNEETANMAYASEMKEEAPPEQQPDTADEVGGKDGMGAAMALAEGTKGRPDTNRVDSHIRIKRTAEEEQVARTQALEAARHIGILGDAGLQSGAYFASLTATGEVSSGFDETNAWGADFGAEGEGAGSFGYGRNGFGQGGGCVAGPCGIIGSKYGKIGNGHNFGEDWGGPGGRGTGLRRHNETAPTTTIGPPTKDGDLDPAIIRRYVKQNINKISFCYEKELLARPGMAGEVQIQFLINGAGVVQSSAGRGFDSQVAACVADVIHAIKFPQPTNGGIVQVNYPFTFRPSGS
jgi:hypothetical protein